MARGAILSGLPLKAKAFAYGRDHLRTLISSLGRLYRAPLYSTMTTTVIAIALALPAGLYVLLSNLQAIAGGMDNVAKISLFLKLGNPPSAVEELAERLRRRGNVTEVRVITPKQALDEFRASSGLGNALDSLHANPLPPVLVISPALGSERPQRAAALAARLERLAEVDLAQLDTLWLQRLQAIVTIARRGVTAIAAILGLAVLLIVGNTIRLEIQNRREEIEVIKLVGATDAFIRRPFLYCGVWYGLLGGVLAWLLVFAAMLLMEGPAEQLAILYDDQYRVLGPGVGGTILLLGLGAGLGLSGSWLAVGQHLHAIQPR